MNMNTPFGQFWKICGDIILSGIILAFTVGASMLAYNFVKADEEKANEFKNEAASFVRVGLKECIEKDQAKRTRNSCINEVVTAARNTRGETFALFVGEQLSTEK